MNTLTAFLPIAQAAGGSGQLMTTFVTFGLVILIFYFLIIRPQNKRQKETKKMLDTLKKGDRVVSIGGIRGVIQSVKEDTIIVKVDEATKLEFSRSAIASVLAPKEEKSEDAGKDSK
jgi:preprotein translocase subunit YajC